jgi:hypothetical protein
MWKRVAVLGRILLLWPRSPSRDTIEVWPSAKDVAVGIAEGSRFHFCDESRVLEVSCSAARLVDRDGDSPQLEWRSAALDSPPNTADNSESKVSSSSQAWCYSI